MGRAPQEKPVCSACAEEITDTEVSLVFDSLCGHAECPSACWHPICLMEFREWRDAHQKKLREWLEHLGFEVVDEDEE